MNRSAVVRHRVLAFTVAMVLACGSSLVQGTTVRADGYQRISGEGSSWAANFIDAMRVNVKQFGITVDYNPSGSSSGRKNYLNGTVDFAASDIPFQFKPEDGSAPENPAPGSYAYMPVVAGGTALMYNLIINGKRVTNLRLSGENVVKIFTGAIKTWNDPSLQADNPGLVMPGRAIVPVVRSDGSGSTAQFTKWMISRYPALWNDYCKRSGRAPACGFTSYYPTIPGMIGQNGDLGVSGYVAQNFAEGAIGYVNFSYALGSQFPVAKVLNAAGYYTEPTPENVAVSLLKAKINKNEADPTVYLTQDLEGVFADNDPRNYQLSSYSYFILPTKVGGQFNEAKGKTLGDFAYYMMCQGQQQSASLGYSPMPINLVQASFEQIAKIPGVVVESIDIKTCKNPTFAADGSNTLAKNAPQPQACDKKGSVSQCPNGTGGMRNVPTAVKPDNAPVTQTTVASGGGQPGGGQPGTTVPGPVPTDASGSTILPPDTTVDPTATTLDPSSGGVVDPGPVTCDPETGVGCDSSGGVVVDPNGGQAGGGQVSPVVPTTLTETTGLNSTAFMLLVIVLVMALLVVPPLAWRRLANGRGAS